MVKSPEKKTSLSPSVQSISDIFAKTASSKVTAKNRSGAAAAAEESPIARSVSPFAVRRTGELDKKPPLAEEERTSSPEIFSSNDGGKKTPEDLVRRKGVGHGTNPDLMAEIKEKRASMAHTKLAEEELSKNAEKSSGASASGSSQGLFSGVKLRYVV